jgi:single-stranded-DNA-specific exonuclease
VPETIEKMRGLTRRWARRGCGAEGTGSLMDRVLAARGLGDADEAKVFLNPSMSQLHAPEALPDMDQAAGRILEAVNGGETVAIYGDYDVDGITSTAILQRMIRAICPEARVLTYVPHRLEEGYGLNAGALRSLAGDGASLVVTVDCGITAIEEAKVARQLGVDLIISDHHTPPADRAGCPDAHSVVHPGLPWARAPFADLCGAGVAYKLAWRLATMHCGSDRVHDDLRQLLLDLLGLAAMGAVADVVPLVDENRVITRWGLGRVKHSPFVGVRALVEASGMGGEDIDTERVGFRLAPQLNACGRMGHAREALELMLTDDEDRAQVIARELVKVNRDRQVTEREIVRQACELAEAKGMTGDDQRAIVLTHPDWHPGVVGIVCSRLVDRYCRPTILMQDQGEICAGSGRSIDGYDLHAGLVSCADMLERFGGHPMAAGLKIKPERLDAFAEAFTEHANARLGAEDLVRTVGYDCDARLEDLEQGVVEQLNQLAPFGRDNPPIHVRLKGVRLNGTPRTMGQKARHLSLELVGGGSGRGIRAVAWGWGEHLERIPSGAEIEAIVKPKLKHWKGRTSVEVEIQDLMILE